MEPVTQVLASAALSRAGLSRTSRLAPLVLLATALAPDVDLLSSLGGPDAYLRYHRTLFHSIAGGAVLAAAIAFGAYIFDRGIRRVRTEGRPLSFGRAYALALIGVAFHIILDLLNSGGVQLLWPFHEKWFAWSVASDLDLWILTLLAAALVLPELFGLVSEEIGERKRKNPARQRWAIAALALFSIYAIVRVVLHSRAVDALNSRTYRGNIPLSAGAFPNSVSPIDWRGVIATDNALIELDVPLGASGRFDPESGIFHFKPEPSPALDAARRTAIARRFLAYARFPLASIEPREDSFHFELRDLRLPADSTSHENLIAVVDLDSRLSVLREELRFPAGHSH
ncbi:MAG TPA: metal-dependent hydrolase [Candidatus Acidoferrales bacterium]|nr:metal-dependent hydrolase [Candidatus Acidoferrales bacterium]